MMIQDLFGTLVGQLSLLSIFFVIMMAAYFIRMFGVWSARDQALAEENLQLSKQKTYQ